MVMTQQPDKNLTAAEALTLLGDVRFGRVVFTTRAMPDVRPVRHVVCGDRIIIAAGPELVLGATSPSGTGASQDTIVAYEADELDGTGCTGWSVVVVGRACPVTEEGEIGRYRELLPAVTVPDQLVSISADVVNGYRLERGADPVCGRTVIADADGGARLPVRSLRQQAATARRGADRESQPGGGRERRVAD
jgi:hypothetical protein